MHSRIVVVLILLIGYSTCSSSTYKAAVVEYAGVYSTEHVTREQALSIMSQNLDNYEKFIQKTSEEGVNIILFPEDGLYGVDFYSKDKILPYLEYLPDVPVPYTDAPAIYPCQFTGQEKQQSPILVRTSCMAEKYNITIVLDMGEVRYCNQLTPNCPRDGRFQYNTLIAVSNTGQFLAKYHKSHLYYEPQFDAPLVPELVWFDSSFGVRFGLIICFDIMFEYPQFALRNNYNVTNFLWSSWWVNEPPLITGTQVELARSISLPSNFLASGIGLSYFQSGSGIYSYGDPIHSWFNPTFHPLSRLMIADLPDVPADQSEEYVKIPEKEVLYKKEIILSELLSPDQDTFGKYAFKTILATNPNPPVINTFTITPGMLFNVSSTSYDLVCTATVQISSNSVAGELFGVYSLSGIYNNLFPASICGLLRCYDAQCTDYILTTDTEFTYFSIESSASPDTLFINYPLVAGNYAEIMAPDMYSVNADQTKIESVSESPFKLLNAALFGLQKKDI